MTSDFLLCCMLAARYTSGMTTTSRPVSLHKCECPIATTHQHTAECAGAWDSYTDALMAWEAAEQLHQVPAAGIVEGDVIALRSPERQAEVVLAEEDGPRVRWIVRDLATGADATVTRLRTKRVPIHVRAWQR